VALTDTEIADLEWPFCVLKSVSGSASNALAFWLLDKTVLKFLPTVSSKNVAQGLFS